MKRFNKSTLIFALAAVFVISGCLGNGVETTASKDVKHILPVIPGIFLGAPSKTAVSSASTAATITVTATDAQDINLSAANIGTVSTGDASCTVGVSNLTTSTAQVSLTSCTGDGLFRVYVKEGAVTSSTNTSNEQSTVSTAVTVDNTGPVVSSFTPATDVVADIPTTIVITFNEAIDSATLTAADFTMNTGTCGTDPTFASKVMSNGNKTATVTLNPAVCTDTQTAIISINTDLINDALSNSGASTSTSRTYTFSSGPTVSFGGAWSITEVNSASAVSTISATFANGNLTSPTIDGTSIGLDTTGGTATCPTISGTGVSAAGATIRLSGCTGDGPVRIFMEPDILFNSDTIGNLQSANSVALNVDNTKPTITAALTPATSTVSAIPATVTFTFDDDMDATSLDASEITLGGNCGTPPTKGVVAAGSSTTFDLPLTGGACADGETLTVTTNGNLASDFAGNVGNAGVATATYTFDSTGPGLNTFTPANATVNSIASIGNLVATFNQTLQTTSFTSVDFALGGGSTCATPPTVGAPSFSTSVVTDDRATSTLTGGSCGHGETLIYTVNPAGVTDTVGNAGIGGSITRTFTFDTQGPVVTVAGVNATNATGVQAHFDEPATGMDVSDFQITGCTVNPVAINFNPIDSQNYEIDLDDSGATCVFGETLVVTVNAVTAVVDALGNPGFNSDNSSFPIP